MTWVTWRQFRTPALVTAAVLALFGVALLATGANISHAYETLGVATCGDDCSRAVASFLTAARSGINGVVHDLAAAVVLLLPAVIGVFWGAPLVARELDAGTHRVAWTQSVGRGRWLAAKLAVVGAASALTAGLASWAVTQWAHHVDAVDEGRIGPAFFSVRGIVPIGYALLAFALGMTFGMVIRRPVPAMAATAAVYGGLLFAWTQWVRATLVSPVSFTRPLDVEHLDGVTLDPSGQTLSVVATIDDVNGWVTSSRVLTPSGTVFSSPAAESGTHCGPGHTFETCQQWLSSQHLVQSVTYHPESQFWHLQWVEAGIFAGLAALLAGFCFWWVRRVA